MLGGQPNHDGNFAFLFNYTLASLDHRCYDGSNLNTYLEMRGLESDVVHAVGPTGV